MNSMKDYHYHDIPLRGTIERVDYTTLDEEGNTLIKYANVYLPYGYDKNDTVKKYNILYLMHGGGGNADAFLDCCYIKNMLDASFFEKYAEPMIVVFPSYYKQIEIERTGKGTDAERMKALFFQKEFTENLIPAVESKYHTYLNVCTKEDMIKSRNHRAFSGFSMGACVTWYAFTKNLEVVSKFIPLSGDCWELMMRGGSLATEETAKFLHDFVLSSEYQDDFKIFAATGTKDMACEGLTPLVEEMKKYPDTFKYSEDMNKGNFYYLLIENEIHAYETVFKYLYHFLPYIFK